MFDKEWISYPYFSPLKLAAKVTLETMGEIVGIEHLSSYEKICHLKLQRLLVITIKSYLKRVNAKFMNAVLVL